MKSGTRVKTNPAFEEMGVVDRWSLPWRGTLVKRFDVIDGCWEVEFDGIPITQFVNEAYLEEETLH